jgi:hypothetical protein
MPTGFPIGIFRVVDLVVVTAATCGSHCTDDRDDEPD